MPENDFTLADPRANEVLQKLRDELALATPWRYIGRPVLVYFPLAATVYEVQHTLTEIPDGVQIITADCLVIRALGRQWTKTLAYLQSNTANSFAVLVFGILREETFSVTAS